MLSNLVNIPYYLKLRICDQKQFLLLQVRHRNFPKLPIGERAPSLMVTINSATAVCVVLTILSALVPAWENVPKLAP